MLDILHAPYSANIRPPVYFVDQQITGLKINTTLVTDSDTPVIFDIEADDPTDLWTWTASIGAPEAELLAGIATSADPPVWTVDFSGDPAKFAYARVGNAIVMQYNDVLTDTHHIDITVSVYGETFSGTLILAVGGNTYDYGYY